LAESRVVTVEIAGQRYPIRSALEERYVAELAAYVDEKMRAASDAAPTTDMLGLAVLVALNIADEYFRARDLQSSTHGELNERALRLEEMVDGILAQVAERKAVTAP
jgi:cell division protein ZapA